MFVLLGGCLLIMWGVKIYEVQFDASFAHYGILPRTGLGLRGLLFGPFIHGNWDHLIANSIPFLVLGVLLAMHGSKVFIYVSMELMFIGGLLVWICGYNTFHIGASGVVFGYLGFLITYGWYVKRIVPVVISIVVFIIYGGAIIGILPSDPHVSWYSHLFGFIVGIQAARERARQVKQEIQT